MTDQLASKRAEEFLANVDQAYWRLVLSLDPALRAHCSHCGRRLRLKWWMRWFRARCSNQEMCSWWATVAEPDPIYPDLPPDDMHVCASCHGTGDIPLRQDYETGIIDFGPCVTCGGTGAL